MSVKKDEAKKLLAIKIINEAVEHGLSIKDLDEVMDSVKGTYYNKAVLRQYGDKMEFVDESNPEKIVNVDMAKNDLSGITIHGSVGNHTLMDDHSLDAPHITVNVNNVENVGNETAKSAKEIADAMVNQFVNKVKKGKHGDGNAILDKANELSGKKKYSDYISDVENKDANKFKKEPSVSKFTYIDDSGKEVLFNVRKNDDGSYTADVTFKIEGIYKYSKTLEKVAYAILDAVDKK